jgi:hypothetical protein
MTAKFLMELLIISISLQAYYFRSYSKQKMQFFTSFFSNSKNHHEYNLADKEIIRSECFLPEACRKWK